MDRHLTRRAAPRWPIWAAAATATAVAWTWLGDGAPLHRPHHTATHPAGPLQAFAMWQAMMVAMMAPVVAPWMSAYTRLVDDRPGRAAVSFAGGYFAIWAAYSAAATALQTLLLHSGLLQREALTGALAGLTLAGAGVYQLSPVRAACLTHCRNPLTYFLARWKNGPTGGFRLGLEHGAWCVGCCWALMLTGFALGLMNLAWMAVLTVLIAAEQTAPAGQRIGRAAGVAFVLWGLLLLR